MTLRFDPLDYMDKGMGYTDAHQAAKKDRNQKLKELKAQGKHPSASSLPGQLRPYKSFGVPDGRTRTMYYVNVEGY